MDTKRPFVLFAVAVVSFALGWATRGQSSASGAFEGPPSRSNGPVPILAEREGLAPGRGVKDPEDRITPLLVLDPAALVMRAGLRPGLDREPDDVVTPLNVRDPTALVIGLPDAQTRCEPAAPPPWEVRRSWNASSAPTQPRG
jgi:hypothetical protein